MSEDRTSDRPKIAMTAQEAQETLDRIKAGEKYFYEQRRQDYLELRNYYIETFNYSIAQELGVHEDVLRAHVKRVAGASIKKRSFANVSETAVRTFFDNKFIEKADKQIKWRELREAFTDFITDRLKTDDEFRAVCESKFKGENFASVLLALYLIDSHTSYLQVHPFEHHYAILRKRFIGPKPKRQKSLKQLQDIAKKHAHRTNTSQLYTNPFKPVERWLSVELGLNEELLAVKLKEHPEFNALMTEYAGALFEDLVDLLQESND